MLWQLIQVKNKLPLGSQKHFIMRFKPIKDAINYKALRKEKSTALNTGKSKGDDVYEKQ